MTEKTVEAIGIDGPAGSGKSTIARQVAERLGFTYIDTGAMYRAVALQALRRGIDLEDETAMLRIATETNLSFDRTGTIIYLNNEDVSAAIRTPEITAITRYAARVKEVRELLVCRQQEMAQQRRVVMEGRDITTVVLAQAKWRIFLTATPEVRARRRLKDFSENGHTVDYNELLKEIIARDKSDNAVGPMKKAQELAKEGRGIYLLDTSELTQKEVIDNIVNYVEAN